MKYKISAEVLRLMENEQRNNPLERWGSYLSERQWGTVREDYSASGDAWNYFPYEHARSRAYIWGEDGIGGLCDYFQNICFAPAFWNGKDPYLKERLFGLSNGQGNHGEDVKELYYHLDNLPSHYYMRYLYKYPQEAFPYQELITKNAIANLDEPEFELLDTDVFKEGKYFDIQIEYAKMNSNDICIRISITNHAIGPAPITVLPQVFFYNRWQQEALSEKPVIQQYHKGIVELDHERMEPFYFYYEDTGEILFTENETNAVKHYHQKPKPDTYYRDAFHKYIVHKKLPGLIDKKEGTKFSPVYRLEVGAGETKTISLRLSNAVVQEPFNNLFEKIFELRKEESNEFMNTSLRYFNDEISNIQRLALSGLMWSKQYYHYDVEWWLKVPDGLSKMEPSRLNGRNHTWTYLKNHDIVAMPDKWEYPWYAAWDLAFHTISYALVDPAFAKHQLILMMREWYMAPDGQLPAYEWDFNSVNPPVHAFATLEVYRIDKRRSGTGDLLFLKRAFQKLIINFTWWVNRKDANGNSIFEGGFLGLDNIGIFNRNESLGAGYSLEQTDGTSWMGMYALNMMEMAYEIALHDIGFEDSVTKFYEHFVIIAEALNSLGLWNNDDNFFYDVLSIDKKKKEPLKVRSIIGIIPIFAVSEFLFSDMEKLPDFMKRMTWFENYREKNNLYLPNEDTTDGKSLFLSLVNRKRLNHILERLLNEDEFLGPYGIRSLSKHYEANPYSLEILGNEYTIQYEPAESRSSMFGGNSNWRGPVWVPMNYLIIKSLARFGEFYGDDFKVEFPAGSGKHINLVELSAELTERLMKIFVRDKEGNRPVHEKYNWFYNRPENKDLITFYEYFNADNGRGLGANHQTGWTALILNLMEDFKR